MNAKYGVRIEDFQIKEVDPSDIKAVEGTLLGATLKKYLAKKTGEAKVIEQKDGWSGLGGIC